MIHSVVGQNERWAQLAALQSSPAVQSGQGSGSAFSNVGTTAADATVVNPVAGSTSPALSSNMSFMLMMFGGGLISTSGRGSASGTGLAGGSGSTTGTGSAGENGPATQTVGSPDDTSGTQGGTGLASMLADLQSLMASLTGGTSAATSTDASTTAPSGASAASGGGTSSASNSLLQDVDNIFSNLGTMVATTGSAQPTPPPTGGTSAGQPSEGNDITNTGSAAVAGWGDGPAGPGGGWPQQFAIAAYELGNVSGLNGASASALQSIAV